MDIKGDNISTEVSQDLPSVSPPPANPSQNNQLPTTPPLEVKKKSNKSLTFALVLLFLSASGVAGYFAYQNQQIKKQLTQSQPSSEPISPTPTPDPTTDWQSYTNEKYGYTFKYPNGWFSKKDTYQSSVANFNSFKDFDTELNKAIFMATFLKSNFEYKSIKEYLDDSNKEFEKTGGAPNPGKFISNAEIAGKNAAKVDLNLPGILNGESIIYFVINNQNQLLELRLQLGINTPKDDFKPTFDQILSTFRFLDTVVSPSAPSPTPVVLDKTYIDKDYGYQIKYSDDWQLRRTYGIDIEKAGQTDILSGFDLHLGNNYYTRTAIIFGLLDAHGLTDIEEWIEEYDLNYPKNAYKQQVNFNNIPAIKYEFSDSYEKKNERIYFLYEKYAYRIDYWEKGPISNSTKMLVESFKP